MSYCSELVRSFSMPKIHIVKFMPTILGDYETREIIWYLWWTMLFITISLKDFHLFKIAVLVISRKDIKVRGENSDLCLPVGIQRFLECLS